MKPTTIENIKITVLIAVVFGVAAVSTVSFASQGNLVITEIMYDAPGSDSGHEWIEIANIGEAPADIYGYKLFEAGVNHNISAAVGTTTLASGEVAVIANNTQKFLEDFPQYTGTLFKSSFSLSNTGEGLVLKDSKLIAVVSITYSLGVGAAGDGNSLHRSASAWVVGAPNPGSLAPTSAIVKASAPAASAKKSSASESKSKSTSSAAVAGSDIPFQTPTLPQDNTLWTTVLGLAALIVVGVGGVLYVRNTKETPLTAAETTPSAEEFEIQ